MGIQLSDVVGAEMPENEATAIVSMATERVNTRMDHYWYRRALSVPARFLAVPKGYSWCGRCKLPWSHVEGHSTHFAKGQGCFPLCVYCWGELTIEQRLPYYYALWVRSRQRGYMSSDTLAKIIAAVNEGL